MNMGTRKELGNVSPEVRRRFDERFLEASPSDWFRIIAELLSDECELDPAEASPVFWHLLANELEGQNQEDVAEAVMLLVTRVYADGPFLILERVAYKDLRISAPAIKFWYPAVFSPFLWESGINGIEGIYTNFDAEESHGVPRCLKPFPGLGSAGFISQWNNALMAAWGRGR